MTTDYLGIAGSQINYRATVLSYLGALAGGGAVAGAVNLTKVGGTAFALGQAVAASSIPVVLPSGTNVPTNITQVGGTALAFGQAVAASSIPVVLPATQQATLTTLADSSKTFQTTETADTTSITKIDPIQNPASGGTTQVVKASAGKIHNIQVFNKSASWRYLKLYNKATDAASTDTPLKNVWVPPGGGVVMPFPKGLRFTTGIAYRATTGYLDNDVTSPTAGDMVVNLEYI